MSSPITLIDRPELQRRLAIRSRVTLRRRLRAGLLPPPIAAGGAHVRWVADEIDLVLAARVAGADDATTREVVRRIVAARGNLGRASLVQPEAAHAV